MPAESIVAELMEIIQEEIAASRGEELSAKENRAIEVGRMAARMALSEMLAADRAEPVLIECECGEVVRSKQTESRTVVTLAGTHIVKRRKYYCGVCGRSSAPRDVALGIGRGNYSAGVVALAAEASAGFPYETCEDFLSRRFGLDICYKQIQRIAGRTGQAVAGGEWRLAEEAVRGEGRIESSEKPSRLTISADGLMIHTDGHWQEMKVGSFLSEYGRSTIATMERAEPFGKLLYSEALRRGVEQAGEVVFVADGAAWIWNLAAHHFPGAIEIVDWYHAKQHLWEVANSWYGEGSSKARSWVKRNEARLAEDGVCRVIASIKQWRPADEDSQRVKRENEHYFTTNAHRMRYRTFSRLGYTIGSGSVESACKQYGHGRFKLPGMRWKLDGVEPVAHLRSAVLNRRTSSILEAAKMAA